MKPVYQTTTPDNQITTQIRPPHPSTTPDHRPDPTTKSDHQITTPPPIQTTSSDHPTRPQDTIVDDSASNQHSIPSLLNGTGQVHSLWVGSRVVYRALDEPCKAYFPHTFGLKFPDFFRLYLTVVRLVSGVPWAGKGLPCPFS